LISNSPIKGWKGGIIPWTIFRKTQKSGLGWQQGEKVQPLYQRDLQYIEKKILVPNSPDTWMKKKKRKKESSVFELKIRKKKLDTSGSHL
jgi:hypothetical protein